MEQDHIPQVHPSQMQQQGLPPYFTEYTYVMANWAQDVSSRDRMPPPAFPQPFYEAAELYRQSSLARTNAFDRKEYYRIQSDGDTQPMYYPFPPSGPGGSSGAQQ
ncbi:hypothetical protein MTR_0063s0010 [Medicago truncatula]|uniref:Uncharacterized protein n=1 Tax=Medicago truncatula TaxID=3880 RepID=A0A072TTS4_MEDTR|nr:hypothetical protein MTR_0063s0010 [Medicago truncatula]